MKKLLLAVLLALSLPSLAAAQGVFCSTGCPPYIPVAGSYLAADYTNATTTFSNTAISVPLRPGKKYIFEVFLYVTESTAADGAKLDFNGGTATATSFVASCLLYNAVGTPLAQSNATTVALATAINIAATTDALVHTYSCQGSIEPATAGTFIVRGAQNAHTAGTLTIKRGSFLTLQDLSSVP